MLKVISSEFDCSKLCVLLAIDPSLTNVDSSDKTECGTGPDPDFL